jgi:hypothetical protein
VFPCSCTYFHCSFLYYNYSRALWIKCISYRDLIKFPYFADTTENRIVGKTEGDFKDNSIILFFSKAGDLFEEKRIFRLNIPILVLFFRSLAQFLKSLAEFQPTTVF